MAGTPISFSSGGTTTVHDLNRKKVLTAKLKQAPAALQTLRRNIIENANKMVQEMKKYRFNEISEIVRVCTTLGIERAYLRGLIWPIASEEDIDKYIHRFNLNGALPFQDKNNPTGANWKGGGEFAERAFFYSTKNTILLQCIRQDGEPFLVCNGESIELASLDPPELPMNAFIPKYRSAGPHPNLDWLPSMKCQYLFNQPDIDNCVTTTDVTSTSNQTPDLNQLIPVNVNPFPYTTPNRGFPFFKTVNPIPKPIRMVMDGSPVDGEKVILANRFELSGTITASVGDSSTFSIINTGDLDYPTEIIPDDTGVTLANTDIIVVDEFLLNANTANVTSNITSDTDDNLPDSEDVDITEPPEGGDPGDPPTGPPTIDTPTTGTSPPEGPGPGPVDDIPGDADPEDPTTSKPIVYKPTEGDPIDGEPDSEGDPPTIDTERDDYEPEEPLPPGDLPQIEYEFPIITIDGRFFSEVPILTDYHGEAFIKKDPIVGTGTRFTEELYDNDLIEMQYLERTFSGIFYTIGTNKLYYQGDEFISSYRTNIEIVMGNVLYRITGMNPTSGTLNYYGYTFNYNAIFTLVKLKNNYVERSSIRLTDTIFSSINDTVNVYPTGNNRKLSAVSFSTSNILTERTFELGDLIQINGVYCRFKGMFGNTLTGVYRVDGGDINQSIQNAVLTRATKFSRAFPDDEFTQAFGLPFRLYYRVDSVVDDSNITVTPNFNVSQEYEGKLYRIGFNARSVSQSPDLLNTAFNVDGVAQFLPDGAATDNSPVFFVPKAATEKVILFDQHSKQQITTVPAGMSAKSALPVVSPKSALEGKYLNSVYDYTTYPSTALNTIVFPSNYNPIFDEEEKGQLYFTDGDDKYIVLETIEENNPVSHGFGEGDLLTIRKVKYNPDLIKDDPYGDLIRHTDGIFSTHMNQIDYDDCGMLIEVAQIVNPHRFKVLKEGYSCSSKANEFFHAYDLSTTHYLTATNGKSLEYWAKYFSPVYMDGTITANSYGEYILDGGNVQRTIKLCSKDTYTDRLRFNYNVEQFSFSYWLGSTAVNIEVNNNVVELNPGSNHSSGNPTTDDGTFILSIKDDVVSPANLLDTYLLKVVEYEYVQT